MPTLNWIGKEKVVNHHRDVPFRVLEHQYGFTAEEGETKEPTGCGNMIIHGDNLEALKALLPEYEGKIKCIYIDPPYNTGKENWMYNDNVSDPRLQKWLGQVVGEEGEDLSRHDKWLCMMYPRLKLLYKFLKPDGSIWISLDDNECHSLKLVLDEIFGIGHLIGDIIWRKRDGAPNDRKLGYIHEHILVYGKSKSNSSKKTKAELSFNLMPRSEKANSQYKVFREPNGPDPKGPFRKIDTTANGKGGRYVESLYYPVKNPYTGEHVYPREGTCWRHSKDEMLRLAANNRLYWGVSGTAGTPMRKLYLSETKQGMTIPSIWWDIALNQHGAKDIEMIFGKKAFFETPKPIDLINLIIHIASDKNSIILDSFAGSGTTAHTVLNLNKQDAGNRKFILVEMEDYAESITAERIKRISKGYGEKKMLEGTGGGFDYYELGKLLFIGDNQEHLNEEVGIEKIRQYIWYSETRTAFDEPSDKTESEHYLGNLDQTAYYFYYQPDEITTLDHDFLATIKTKAEQYVIYADNCLLSKEFMVKHNIIFKKIPRDITRF
ncbi:site-specific DNA-methyltransferase [Cyclobacterium plantarum]|uniref:site-specific DNA-methyltransferase n=1 Tax=Cyclobacterium plantarum TaxID=2716263 RepID=UPI003F7063E7